MSKYVAIKSDSDLPLARDLVLEYPPPPPSPYCGSNPRRQGVGLPGHCEPCAQHGHIVAHPDFGCGDVGCNSSHE